MHFFTGLHLQLHERDERVGQDRDRGSHVHLRALRAAQIRFHRPEHVIENEQKLLEI